MQVALIGYGEVGRILAEDLARQAHGVVAYDVKLEGEGGNALREHAAKAGITLAQSHASAVQPAELVISAVTASQAVPVAEAIAPGLTSSVHVLDFSSASPGAKIRAAKVVEAGPFGPRGSKDFARSADWRVEADRILNRTKP